LNSNELMQFQTVLRLAICFLAALLLVCFSILFPSLIMSRRAIASPTDSIASQVYSQNNLSVLVPDWSQLTFAALPPIRQNVDITASAEISDADRFGLARRIQSGMTPDQYLKLGDFEDSLYPQYMSLQSIASVSQAQYDLSQVALSGFNLIRDQTLNDLRQAIPGIGDFSVSQIPLITALLKQAKLGDWTNKSLSELVQWKPDLGNLKLGAIKLDPFSVNDLPGLKDIPLANLQNWQNSLIKDVPGLKDVPLSQFPVSLVNAGALGVVDMVYGEKESDRTNTISGSDVEGFQVPCRENCVYTELAGPQQLYGKQWISGKYQQVKGGHGPLAIVNGGKEPTGRHPFGTAFKVVIWDVVESEGRVDTALFFRICHRILGVSKTCTPYFIGPVPFMSYHENDPMLVGLLDAQGGSTTGVSIPQDVIDKARAAGVSLGEDDPEFSDSELCGTGPGGVDLGALAAGISGIEGGYNSAGYYDPESAGRGLGRYQYMTFRSDVRVIIAKHPGGEDFLQRANVNDNSSGYIAALDRELPNYFTQADQDALFKQDQASNIRIAMSQIDPTTQRPFTGTRLIERVGQIHFGGPNAAIDGSGSDIHGQLSIYGYGKELSQNYQAALQKMGGKPCAIAQGSGKSTGKMIYPEGANAPIPSGGYFGADRGDHIHAGVDFSMTMGTPIKAADGGTVEFAGRTDPDGFGTLIVIDHGNGIKTYYGHPSHINVKTGQKVSQGQIIGGVGQEGDSTGPHLHFEVRRNGTPVDPMPYLHK
jgi:murein DD-endopeptidase MepM/ murein hydrolase activator NlpD